MNTRLEDARAQFLELQTRGEATGRENVALLDRLAAAEKRANAAEEKVVVEKQRATVAQENAVGETQRAKIAEEETVVEEPRATVAKETAVGVQQYRAKDNAALGARVAELEDMLEVTGSGIGGHADLFPSALGALGALMQEGEQRPHAAFSSALHAFAQQQGVVGVSRSVVAEGREVAEGGEAGVGEDVEGLKTRLAEARAQLFEMQTRGAVEVAGREDLALLDRVASEERRAEVAEEKGRVHQP